MSNFKTFDRIKALYPMVNESETPLPRSWNPKDKFKLIGLSENNLRAHFKGPDTSYQYGASVRATHPIPVACGLYYFEVKVLSKGCDGYMGIGLTAIGVNLNRIPGWDKNSYGYHGDDGHTFCSPKNGRPYGPTFTTGDVIGCGVNQLDQTCFYTKNGHNLGIAFTDLVPNLYPTVGLQTPGVVVEANFGQEPFVFDIEDMMKELRVQTRQTIERFPFPDTYGNGDATMKKMVMSYLIHNGYCSTAEAFAKNCGQSVAKDLVSMKNRQRIQQLVLDGHIKEAEEETKQCYPNLLESNPNVLFMLRCRHFVELVGQSMPLKTKPLSNDNSMDESICNGNHRFVDKVGSNCSEDDMEISYTDGCSSGSDDMDICIKKSAHGSSNSSLQKEATSEISNSLANGTGAMNAMKQVLQVGCELQSLRIAMRREMNYETNENNTKLMESAFSLLAYANPWDSPVGWQLSPRQREPVRAALNSAILQTTQLPKTPPLQVAVNHALLLLKDQVGSVLGASAFIVDGHADK